MKLYAVSSCTQLCTVIQYYIILLLARDHFFMFYYDNIAKCHFINNSLFPIQNWILWYFLVALTQILREFIIFHKLKKVRFKCLENQMFLIPHAVLKRFV